MTQLCFSEWLIERELREIEESLDEGWKDWAKYGALAAGGLVAASGASSMPKNIATRVYNPTAITQAQQSSINSIDAFVSKFNQERKTNINKSQIKMIRPSEIIKKSYGDKYDSVLQKAKLAQGPQKINIGNGETYEIPPNMNSAIMQASKMDKQVPVVFLQSSEYDQIEKGNSNSKDMSSKSLGFCSKIVVNGERMTYCVIDQSYDNWEQVLAHELSHTTQNVDIADILSSNKDWTGKDKATWNYYFHEPEIGVRLAALKRDYFQLTGKIVDNDTIGDALKHLTLNKNSYSNDAKDLLKTFHMSIKDGSQKEFFKFLKDNVNSVVKTYGKNTKGMYA